jgi:prolyl oligopeptidase
MPSLSLGSYVYSHNSGLQAQSVLYTQPSPDGDPTVLLDPNTLSSDGTVALGSTSFSEDGTMMAYTLSSGGSDWRTVHVLRVDQADGTPSPLADKLDHAKFTSLAWTHDGKGFFYHRYPPPAKAADLGTEVDSNVDKEMWCVLRFFFFLAETRASAPICSALASQAPGQCAHTPLLRHTPTHPFSALFRYHVVGRPQSEDTFVYAIPEHPTWHIGGEVTDDGR